MYTLYVKAKHHKIKAAFFYHNSCVIKILFVKIAKNVLNVDIVFGTACCCFNKQLDYNDDHSFSLSSLL